MGHACGEVLGKIVNVGGADLRADGGGCIGGVGGVWGDEVLGEVVEDRC